MKIYFGHPINFYNTLAEEYLLKRIRTHFPRFEIENPGAAEHEIQCSHYKAQGLNPMQYFFGVVLPKMDAGVFFAFPEDLKFGAGVYGEAEELNKTGKPIYEITLDGNVKPMHLDLERRLSVEETRARIKIRPM